jgi:hypothetical protein
MLKNALEPSLESTPSASLVSRNAAALHNSIAARFEGALNGWNPVARQISQIGLIC